MLWWLLCHLFRPTVPILIDQFTPVYLPVVGILSLACLSIPGIVYLCSRAFRELRWQEQLQSAGIVLMLTTIVFRAPAYLHAQLIFFAFTAIAFLADKDRQWRKQPVFFYACWIYVLWLSISMLWTHHHEESIRYFNRLVPLVSYSLCFATISLSETNYHHLLTVFWRVVCIGCLLCVASGIYESHRMGFAFSDFIQFHKTMIGSSFPFFMLYGWSGTPHPSFNVLWIMAGMSCSFYLADKRYISRFELLCGIMLMLLIVIGTQSRIGYVMWFIIAFCGIIYSLRNYKLALSAVLLFLAVGGYIFARLHTDSLRNLYTDPAREQLFQIARDYLRADPWVGSGLGGMTYEYVESVIGYEFKSWWPQYQDAETMYPHNQFLGDWMQSGIMGLIVLIGLIGCGFYEAIKSRSFIGIAYMTALFFFMMIEMPLHYLGGTTVIAFFLCFIFSHHDRQAIGTGADTPLHEPAMRTK